VANGDGAQQLANSMLGALLAVARRQAGDTGVDRILSRAGEERSASDLQRPGGWSTYQQGLALFRAAAEVLDDPDVGRKAGIEVLRQYSGTEVLAILRSIGSPAELLRVYPAISAKQSTITQSEVVEVGDSYGLVAQVTPDHTRDPLFCGYTLGALSQFPVLYGMEQASVQEIECQTRGDDRCLIRVEWDPTSSARADLEHEVGMLKDRILVLTERYESLEAVARELASIRDVTSMLETITRQAGVAVRAQRYLLVARLPGDRAPRIHHVGFTDEGEAGRAADDVMGSDMIPNDPSRIVVDIHSSRRNFGRLAVFYPHGYQFLPQERTLLMAYAGHAAAALDTAAALAEAQDRNSSLSALLALAMALAEQSSRSRVAQLLADAVPDIAGYEQAHVLLWEEGDARLSHVASNVPIPHGTAQPDSVRGDALAGRLLTTAGPTIVTAGSDPALSPVLSLTGLGSGVVVPIAARSTLFGVLAVGSDRGAVESDESIRERLSGVGSLAATALDSVALLDEVRHQALHDPLTELANSRLFEQQVSQALSLARRRGSRLAMLFIDLDGFKSVNDVHGHKVGDELLRTVAARLLSIVRDGDTVARIGGDEFGIVARGATRPEEAEIVARRVVKSLKEPFEVQGRTLAIGASVGITMFPAAGAESYDMVVSRADSAMYRAKAEGRSRFHLAPT
jgi:diguanylate cyclase (GGDEF)-like protein